MGLAAGKLSTGKGSSCAYWGNGDVDGDINGDAYGDVYGERYGDSRVEVVRELRAVDWDLVELELELLVVIVPFRDVLGLTMASWVELDFFEVLTGIRVII